MLLYINDDSLQLLKGEVRGTQRLPKGLLYIFYQPLVHPSLPWRLGEVELPSDFLFCEEVLRSFTLSYFLDPCCCRLESHCVVGNDHPRPRSPRYKGVKLPLKFFSRLSFGQLQMHRPGSRASEHQHVSFLFLLVHFLF